MRFSYKNQTLWSIYITIENLDVKTWQCQKWLKSLLFGSIFIFYKQWKNENNKNKDLKTKIYYIALKTIL